MRAFRSEATKFIDYKVYGYFLAFLRNHPSSIDDESFFFALVSRVSLQTIERSIKRTFSKGELAALENAKRPRCRLNWDDEPAEILVSLWRSPGIRRRMVGAVEDMCKSQLRALERCSFKRDKTKKRLTELQETLSLSDCECEVVFLSFLSNNGFIVRPDRYLHRSGPLDKILFFAKCLDRSSLEIKQVVASSEKLRRYGCLDEDLDFNSSLDAFLGGIGDDPLSGRYYHRNVSKPLPWDFYESLAVKHGEMLKTLLGSSKSEQGVNVLFYGAPGTGKTSFAHSLAAELGRTCYEVVQSVQNKKKASGYSPEHRFGALEVCDSQVESGTSLLVVDEADEMLRGFSRGNRISGFDTGGGVAGDKGMLNNLLDRIKTPCIWITNTSAEELDESSRRRFDYSIRFEKLNTPQRRSIWRNNVKKYKLGRLITPGQMEKYAEEYETSAGGISTVLRNFAAIRPEGEQTDSVIEKLMKPHCELMGIETRKRFAVSGDYSLEGLNIKGDVGLERIVGAIRSFQLDSGKDPDQPRMNLLLSGPPGSGKTEFVKHLGSELASKTIVKSGSDLLSMWVGGTEKNIQQAFEEAESERALLFFDEIDGLLQSRDRAQRSWEVTQVNELLQRMEAFDGIFVAATNFVQNLDQASLRRFTFKLGFDYLSAEGKTIFFRKFFKTELTANEVRELSAIPDLVPGDFRTVRQGVFYLGGSVSNGELIDALRQEVVAKKQSGGQGAGNRMGFNV